MLDVVMDTLMDGFKLLPFLFIAFLIIELLEHKFSNKTKKVIKKAGGFGPVIGSLLGLIPQCGFSVVATNLYVTRVVSIGTLISIYLACSDEMVPILLSGGASASLIGKLLLIKFLIGMISGFVVDLIIRRRDNKNDYRMCEEDNCHCERGIFKSTLVHTVNIFIFIIIVSFVLNIMFEYGLGDALENLFSKNLFVTPFITGLIGFIPNCGSSVIITQLYLKGVISFASMISGLLTGSGVAILILFKSNKNIKDSLKILFILYVIGSLSGVILELFKI